MNTNRHCCRYGSCSGVATHGAGDAARCEAHAGVSSSTVAMPSAGPTVVSALAYNDALLVFTSNGRVFKSSQLFEASSKGLVGIELSKIKWFELPRVPIND